MALYRATNETAVALTPHGTQYGNEPDCSGSYTTWHSIGQLTRLQWLLHHMTLNVATTETAVAPTPHGTKYGN